MSNLFFDHAILNSPYHCPQRHWELDTDGLARLIGGVQKVVVTTILNLQPRESRNLAT